MSSKKIHNKMVWSLLRAPVIFFDSNPIGTMLTRFSRDIAITDFLLPMLLNFLLITGFKIIVTVIFIIITVPWNLITIVIVFIPMFLIRRYTRLAQSDTQRIESISKGPINTRYSSALDGITSIRVYGRSQYYTEGFMHDSDLNASAKFTFNGVTRWVGMRLDFCSYAFMVTTFFIITFLKAFDGGLNKNLASVSIQFALEFSFTLSFMIRMIGEVETLMTSSQRTIEYAEMETEDELKKPGDREIWPESSDIVFKNVYMKYRPHLEPVLKNLNYHVKPGEKVGIIGRTGAGKSSIMQAIFRLVETEADSKIIIGGDDTKELGLHCLRLNISFIPQTPFLMSSSIRENLDPFEHHSDSQIWEVLQEVRLKEYIESLKDGLNTVITDQNVFSVGQKQLICLARAILRKNQILVLDEATANVDIETDSLIQKSIREKFKHCTVLTIAHRLATISDSDTILVMHDGYLKEHGKPEHILSRVSRKESAA